MQQGLRRALDESEGSPVRLLLENTAGAGGTMGVDFRELGQIIDAAGGDPRLGICVDTAHIFESGVDLRTREGIDEVARASSTPAAAATASPCSTSTTPRPRSAPTATATRTSARATSERTRFRLLVNEPAFADLPGILEVPGFDGQGPDKENLARLRALAG